MNYDDAQQRLAEARAGKDGPFALSRTLWLAHDLLAECRRLTAELATQRRCEHCGATTIDNCVRCGAPQCCPQCCRIATMELEFDTEKRGRVKLESELAEATAKERERCVSRIASLGNAFPQFECAFDIATDAISKGA